MAFTTSDICKILVAIFIPPLGVFLERGCGADLLINILLTILGYIPGIFHGKSISIKPLTQSISLSFSFIHYLEILAMGK
ncbi:UPF0057-domain-containing protein [Phlegmacium glaucopus]|nr:UPF0057-domain-containing protein [Phlegmacium glaucopus]